MRWRADFGCRPIKKGQCVFGTDEDDEEELPVGRIKCEEGVKRESDVDGMVKAENEEE